MVLAWANGIEFVSLLCCIQAIRALAPANAPQKDATGSRASAGWVRRSRKCSKLAAMVAGRDDILYIAGEEIIFRSVLINAALLLGSVRRGDIKPVFRIDSEHFTCRHGAAGSFR